MPPEVAIIDSGVNADHPHLGGARLQFLGAVGDDGILDSAADVKDRLGHGTAVAAAIFGLAPEASLSIIRVFEDELTCPFERVIAAIDHALDAGANLVNLSVGTSLLEHIEPLLAALERARAAGATIVAPASFGGLPSYPGALEGAAAVVADPAMDRAAPALRQSASGQFWFASPYPRDLPGLPRVRNLSGVSFATANVTGALAARWEDHS